MIAIVFIGAGFTVIFQPCLNYLVDSYQIDAASAVSANTMLRSLMFNALGIGPWMSILGAVATLMLPLPVLLMRYGEPLRVKSIFLSTVGMCVRISRRQVGRST